ncbi:MAG TPA: hypothetical protein VKM72_30480 [Thermoanaerobaculia bacterium]|nr:hypothetical protein [Thermoanaerobaculia bacterium]
MHSHRSFRPLFVLLLALLFAPWRAEARPSEAHRADAAASPPIERFIGWLVTLWGDVGCTMDPSGGACRESVDNGCTADPSGGCRDSLDNGCTMDPDGGGCRESLDTACGWDPNGGGCRDNG